MRASDSARAFACSAIARCCSRCAAAARRLSSCRRSSRTRSRCVRDCTRRSRHEETSCEKRCTLATSAPLLTMPCTRSCSRRSKAASITSRQVRRYSSSSSGGTPMRGASAFNPPMGSFWWRRTRSLSSAGVSTDSRARLNSSPIDRMVACSWASTARPVLSRRDSHPSRWASKVMAEEPIAGVRSVQRAGKFNESAGIARKWVVDRVCPIISTYFIHGWAFNPVGSLARACSAQASN